MFSELLTIKSVLAPEAHDLEWKRALSASPSRATVDWTAAILFSLLVGCNSF
jgi:hypothetical protein